MSSPVSTSSSSAGLNSILRGGSLQDHGVLQILAIFHARLLTGVIHVRGDGGFKASIYTMDGDIIAAEADAESQRIGQRLIRKKLITPEILKKALEEQSDVQRLGELFVRAKVVTDEAIQTVLGEQFQDALFLCCLLQQGTFRVEIKDAVFPPNFQLLFDTPELLSQGERYQERLGNLVTALREGGLGLAPGSAAKMQRVKGVDLTLVLAAEEDRRLDSILNKSPLEQIATLELITSLLERKVLALAPILAPGEKDKPKKGAFISSLRRGEDGSGRFTNRSHGTVLDFVDLSGVGNIAIATEIPLDGVVETLGVEDLEESERIQTERDAQSIQFPGNSDPKASAASKGSADSELMFDISDTDDGDDLLFTEDGLAVPESQAESLLWKGAGGGPRRAHPTPAPAILSATAPPKFKGINPRQRQSLNRRFQIYNQIYQTLFAHFCQYARKLEVLTYFQGYFALDKKSYPDFFRGVSFRTNGTLSADAVLDNLEAHSYEHPAETFDLALHETLSYLLNDARKLLPNAEAEARMMEAVADIRRQLFRRGAPVPPIGR